MPNFTDSTNRWFKVIEQGHQNTASNTQVITVYDYYQGGRSRIMANSPYVLDDWRTWNTGTASTQYYTVLSDDAWRMWNTSTITYTAQGNGNAQIYQLREPTAEELAAQKQVEEKRARAKVRAKSLLDSMLTPEQRAYMERHGYIPVIGSKGRRYHIRTTGGASGNVELMDNAGIVKTGRFCVHPTLTHDGKCLPTEDQFLAQLLHIQDDEDDFLGKANTVEGVNPVGRHPLHVAA
jgi:hypothetical protein